MANRMIVISIGILAMAAGGAHAAIYKSVDEQGNVVFSDEPTGNAEPVDLPPIPTYTPARIEAEPDVAESDSDAAGFYGSIDITQPEPDATVRDNPGNVMVAVELQPALDRKAGHKVQFYLDGEPRGEPVAGTQLQLQNVDRGTHAVEAAVVDASGKQLMRSSSVRFYLHRQSVNFPTRVQPSNPIQRGPN